VIYLKAAGQRRGASVHEVDPAPTRRAILAATLGLGALTLNVPEALAGSAIDEITPHPVRDYYFGSPMFGVAMSPSGNRLAVVRNIGTSPARDIVLDVGSSIDLDQPRLRHAIGNFEVRGVRWANEDRVLLTLLIPADVVVRRSNGSQETIQTTAVRIVSIDANDGSAVALLQGGERRPRISQINLGRVVDTLPDDPDHILMAVRDLGYALNLHRVNVYTGQSEEIERGQMVTLDWMTLNGQAVVRQDQNMAGSLIRTFVRSGPRGRWQRAWQHRVRQAHDFIWTGVMVRPGVALVLARRENEDFMSARELDLETIQFGPPIMSREDMEAQHYLLDERKRLMGVAYFNPRLEYDFVSPAIAPHHRAMNAFFGNECNVYMRQANPEQTRFIVSVEGPREPGSWYIYDAEQRHFEYIGSRTLLEGNRLAPQESIRAPTRDGASIEAFLTRPASGAPGPIIALVHGGPDARDYFGWNTQAQVLAAQGWWVIQPNFRGSSGYGRAFNEAGWRRWGTRMQEDVEDTLAHAIETYGLDRERVGIMGASYGGYAALMGAVRRPDLYKAAISICGDSDLIDLLASERRDDDTTDQLIYRFWVERIGDPRTDRAMIEQASPRRRVREIQCPVLLVHGVEDKVVPVDQSRRMERAMRDAGKRVELVEIEDHGHGDWPAHIEHDLVERYIALFREAFA
jgi:pimeloyl-ACP methyl ester carboxylesterase